MPRHKVRLISNLGKICTQCGFGEYQEEEIWDAWFDEPGSILRCNNCDSVASHFYTVLEEEDPPYPQ